MANSARPGRYGPVGYQQITSLSASTALTIPAAANGRATGATIGAENQNVRWRDDGTAPTATVGQLLPAGTSAWFDCNLNLLRFIEAAGSATLNVTYYEDTRTGQ